MEAVILLAAIAMVGLVSRFAIAGHSSTDRRRAGGTDGGTVAYTSGGACDADCSDGAGGGDGGGGGGAD